MEKLMTESKNSLSENWDSLEATESAEQQIRKLFIKAYEDNPLLALTHSFLSKETGRGNAHVRTVCQKLVKEGFLESKNTGRKLYYRYLAPTSGPAEETTPHKKRRTARGQ